MTQQATCYMCFTICNVTAAYVHMCRGAASAASTAQVTRHTSSVASNRWLHNAQRLQKCAPGWLLCLLLLLLLLQCASVQGVLSGLLFVLSTAASMQAIQLIGLSQAVGIG
jgi:hypothetical protein